MYAAMTAFVDRLDQLQLSSEQVIRWGCPVPFFGDLPRSIAATVGINPSNREFTNGDGTELVEDFRRLPTLRSLGLNAWSEIDVSHLQEIIDACRLYFQRNPYDRWFKVLEQVLQPAGHTYYGAEPSACHLDLVPFATHGKWTEIARSHQNRLLDVCADALGLLLRGSRLQLLVLNGQSVVDQMQMLTGVKFDRSVMRAWSLPRANGAGIAGVAYSGEIEEVAGTRIGRGIRVIGYNHNLQSSFGVSSNAIANIGRWVRSESLP